MNSNLSMIVFLAVLMVLLCGAKQVSGQQNELENKVNIGFQLSQYQDDFGAGINVSSPWFAHERIAVKVRSNLMFHEHVQDEETTWTPYLNVKLGVAGKTGTIGNFMRLYGEGGVIGLLPSDEFSSESFEFGGYGLFGFEFYMKPDSNYFIELGAVGTGAKADEIINSPIYSNGFTISTGFRFHL